VLGGKGLACVQLTEVGDGEHGTVSYTGYIGMLCSCGIGIVLSRKLR
jgi:hypothetical protein